MRNTTFEIYKDETGFRDIKKTAKSALDGKFALEARPGFYKGFVKKANFLTGNITKNVEFTFENLESQDISIEMTPGLPKWEQTGRNIGPNNIKFYFDSITFDNLIASDYTSNNLEQVDYYLTYSSPTFVTTQKNPDFGQIFSNVSLKWDKNTIEITFSINYNISPDKFVNVYLPGFYGENFDKITNLQTFPWKPINNGGEDPYFYADKAIWTDKAFTYNGINVPKPFKKYLSLKTKYTIEKDIIYTIKIPRTNGLKIPKNVTSEKGLNYINKKKQTNIIEKIFFDRLEDEKYQVHAIYKTLLNEEFYSFPSKEILLIFPRLIKCEIKTKGYNNETKKFENVPMPNVQVKIYNLEYLTDISGIVNLRVPPNDYINDKAMVIKNKEFVLDFKDISKNVTLTEKQILDPENVIDVVVDLSANLPGWPLKNIQSEGTSIYWGDEITNVNNRIYFRSVQSEYEIEYQIWIKNVGVDVYNITDKKIDRINNRLGFTRLTDGKYKIRMLYHYTKPFKISIDSGFTNAVVVEGFKNECDINRLYVPKRLEIKYDKNPRKFKINISSDELKRMYDSFKNVCITKEGIVTVTDPNLMEDKWILTNIFIYCVLPATNKNQLKKDEILKYAVFYDPNDEVQKNLKLKNISIKPKPKFNYDIYIQGTADQRKNIMDKNELPIYNEFDKKLLPFGNNYTTRMDWPFSRSKLTNVELELDNIPDGVAKFAWGYELYHESLEGKGIIEGFDGNTFKIKTGIYKLPNQKLEEDLDWYNINRVRNVLIPQYYIPGKLKVTYNENTEELIVDISNTIRGLNSLPEIQNNLVRAANTRGLYNIINLKIYSWKPGTFKWWEDIEKLTDMDEKREKISKLFNNQGQLINVAKESIHKIYNSLNKEIIAKPSKQWGCHTRIVEGKLIIPNAYDGKYNFIWTYDFIKKNGDAPKNVWEYINNNEIEFLNQDDVPQIIRKDVIINKPIIQYDKGSGIITIKIDKDKIQELENIMDKKYYKDLNVDLLTITPDTLSPNLMKIKNEITEKSEKRETYINSITDANELQKKLSEIDASLNALEISLANKKKIKYTKNEIYEMLDNKMYIKEKMKITQVDGKILSIKIDKEQAIGNWFFVWVYSLKGSDNSEINFDIKKFKTLIKEEGVKNSIGELGISVRESGLFDIYRPKEGPVLNYNKVTDIATFKVPDYEWDNLKNTLLTYKGENFDEFGLSLDIIFYYWVGESLSPLDETTNEAQRGRMFKEDNMLVIKGIEYPNNLRLTEKATMADIDAFMPKTNEIDLNCSKFKFNDLIGIWTYKLKATAYYENNNITAFSRYDLFTPEIANSDLKAFGQEDKSIYSKVVIYRNYLTKNLKPKYFKMINELELEVEKEELQNLQINLNRSNFSSIDEYAVYIWSQYDWEMLTAKGENMGESDYKALFNIKHIAPNINIFPPLNERTDDKKVADSIKITIKDPQNGETRCAWSYRYTLNNQDKTLLNDYKNIIPYIRSIRTERRIPKYFIPTKNVPLEQKFDCERNILTLTIPESEIKKMKKQLNNSFFYELPDAKTTKVVYELYEFSPDISINMIDKLSRFDYDNGETYDNKYIIEEKDTIFPTSNGWSLPYTDKKQKKGVWTYFWSYKIYSNLPFFDKNEYQPPLPLRPVFDTNKNQEYFKNYSKNTTFNNLFIGRVVVPGGSAEASPTTEIIPTTDKKGFDSVDLSSNVNLTLIAPEFLNPSFLNVLYYPLPPIPYEKLYDKLKITLIQQPFKELAGHILTSFFRENDNILELGGKIEKKAPIPLSSAYKYYYNEKMKEKEATIVKKIETANDTIDDTNTEVVAMTPEEILQQVAEKELLELDIKKEKWSIDIKNDWDKLTVIEQNVYINKRNEELKDYSLGNLNYLKFYENIYITFYAYNIQDNLISKEEGSKTLQEITLDDTTFKKTIPLHKILGGHEYKFEATIPNQLNLNLKKEFAEKIKKEETELEELKKMVETQDIKDKKKKKLYNINSNFPNEYNSLLDKHQTYIHSGWGVFYTYEIDLDLEIFKDTSFDIKIPKIPPLNIEKIASKYLNHCPINIIPKVTLIPYRINMFGQSNEEEVICKTKVCNNNAPSYIQKISLGSMNTKALKYSKIVGLNKKEASQILKVPKESLELSGESEEYKKRNEVVIAANEEEVARDLILLAKKKEIKDAMTQNENKFC